MSKKWLGLDSSLLWFSRKCLYSWIHVDTFPRQLDQLDLDPNKPVCYVMHGRSLTNTLVLDEETLKLGLPRPSAKLSSPRERRSIFFLKRREGSSVLRENLHSQSPRLRRLVRAALDDPALDVQIVPVSIFWGRTPDSEDSVLKILFADSWSNPGALRKAIAVLLHGGDTLLKFNAPLSLRQIVDECPDEERAARKIARVLRVHFRKQREGVIGPDMSPRRLLVSGLLRTPGVRAAVSAEAREKDVPELKVLQKARRYADEIAADFSYPMIRLLELFLTWLWERLYDGVKINHLEQLSELSHSHEIIYVPCHRSHIDYLLISYVLFRQGIALPHIAAGDNLNLPVLGSILRRGGAFFLRRSFKGDALYATIFNEYLHQVFQRGFPVEYFIEGGRSRSGRVLQPKTGMLNMTLQSYLRDSRKPIVFMPVYLGYEKLFEGRTYIGELQGKPKQKESLFDLIQSVRRLRKTFGQVHVNFGEPIALDNLLDRHDANWRQAGEADSTHLPWFRGAINDLASTIATRINDAADVNPVNLISVALLSTRKHAMDANELAEQTDIYLRLLNKLHYSDRVSLTSLSGSEVVDYCERLRIVQRMKHSMGDVLYLQEEHALLLTYFRNNTLHLFALPALLACFYLNNHRLHPAHVRRLCRLIYPFLKGELFMHWDEAGLDAAIATSLDALQQEGLLLRSVAGEELYCPEPNTREYQQLHILGESIRQALERYFMAVTLLAQSGSNTLTRKQFVETCQQMAQRLALLHEFHSPEFSDKAAFESFLDTLARVNYLSFDSEKRIEFGRPIQLAGAEARRVLGADARRTIEQMVVLKEGALSQNSDADATATHDSAHKQARDTMLV